MLFKKKNISIISLMIAVFIFVGSVMPVMAAEVNNQYTDAEWETLREKAKDRQRRIIYDNDGDDTVAFPNNMTPSINNILALRTSFLHKYPVDTITYSITRGGFDHLMTRTTEGEPAYATATTNNNLTKWLHEQGTDALRLQMEYAREHGIEIFAGIRMNDATHDVMETTASPNPLFSPFKRERPDLLVGSYDKNILDDVFFGNWTAYNYAEEEIRERFYRVVDELLTDYASDYNGLDGINLDFNRDPLLFKSAAMGQPVTESEREALTALFQRICNRAEEIGKQRGRPILIAVKVPDSMDYCWEVGIDLETWLNRNLVDMVICAIRVEPWENMVNICHSRNKKFYASVEREYLAEQFPSAVKRLNTESFLGRVAGAFAAGADGIQYFNLFSESAVQYYMKPDLETIAYANKRYHPTHLTVPFHEYWLKGASKFDADLPRLNREEPMLVLPNQENKLYLEVGDDLKAIQAAGKNVDVMTAVYGTIDHPEDLIVKIGGTRLEFLSSVEDIHYFKVPLDALALGKNQITFTLPEEGPEGVVTDVIMKGDKLLSGVNQSPWRRMYSGGTGSSETIYNGNYYCVTDGSTQGNQCLYYSLPLPHSKQYTADVPFIANFSCQVVTASDERSVIFYVADGSYVTEVSLQANRVSFLGTGAYTELDTTIMRDYQLKITNKTAFLYVDGMETPILKADLPDERKVFSDDVLLRYPLNSIGGLNEHGLIFGSLSVEGTGKAYWKDIEIVRPRNSAWINDVVVQVNFIDNEAEQHELMGGWHYQTVDADALAVGDWSYKNPYMDVEVDMKVISGAAELLISNGGNMVKQIVTSETTEFRQAGDNSGLIYSWPGDGVRRVQFIPSSPYSNVNSFNSKSENVVSSGTTNISGWLGTKEALAYTQKERDLIRKGGVLVKPLSEDSVVNVSAIRASISSNYLYKSNSEGVLIFEDDCSDLQAKGWVGSTPLGAGKALCIVDAKGNSSNPTSGITSFPPAGQYLAFCKEENKTKSDSTFIKKTIPIDYDSWMLQFDAKFIDLMLTSYNPEGNDVWHGFGVEVFANNRRWRVRFTNQRKIVLLDDITRPTQPVIEYTLLDDQFHTYMLHYDGNGTLSIGVDGMLLANYAFPGTVFNSAERIEFYNNGGYWVSGTNEVYLDNIALYAQRDSGLKQLATVTMSDKTVTYDGNQHSLDATTNPGALEVKVEYEGTGGTIYPKTMTAPTNVGTYAVTAAVKSASYIGSTTAMLTISKAIPSISTEVSTNAIILGQTLGDAVLSATFNDIHGNHLEGTFSWDEGSDVIPAETGLYSYTFKPVDTNYDVVTGQIQVTVKLMATVTLTDSATTYDGNQHQLIATTSPGALEVKVEYEGIGGTIYPKTMTAPINAGTYNVKADVTSAVYTGSAEVRLIIEKAIPSVVTEVYANAIDYGQTLGGAVIAGVFNDINGNQLDGIFTWDEGNHTIPTATGLHAYTFTPADVNYTAVKGSIGVIVKPSQATTYTITAGVTGGNGTISPFGEATVVEGGNQSFTMTPASGYVIDAVTVDGLQQTVGGNVYAFTDVSANHTISVRFTKEKPKKEKPEKEKPKR